MRQNVRFVTPDEFESIAQTVKRHTPDTFPPWFGLALRTMFATGCRPAEIVGTSGREGREEEEGGLRMSRVKPHHGLRGRDVLPNNRLYIEGKHTTPKGRTNDLKSRLVLCADADVWNALRNLASQATDAEANLLLPQAGDGKVHLRKCIERLKSRLPGHLRAFSARWLRHSHAIAAIRAGVDLVSIQRQLGHESLTTTAIYLRFAGLDEKRYLAAFGSDEATVEERDCPACGFRWQIDRSTGALSLDSRIGNVMRRRR